MLEKQKSNSKAFFIIGLRNSGKVLELISRFVSSKSNSKLIKDTEKEIELQHEMTEYNDFIVGDFVDSYEALTLKTLTSYTYFQVRK